MESVVASSVVVVESCDGSVFGWQNQIAELPTHAAGNSPLTKQRSVAFVADVYRVHVQQTW